MAASSPTDTASLRERVRHAVAVRLGIDARALAAFRVAIGVLLLVDLALRARSLTAFYTDAGVLPRSALAQLYPTLSELSLHALSGELWWQVVLFLVAGGFALALTTGYHTRIATVASFVLLLSLQLRNPVVLNAGDVIFRRILLWACFLPLGATWSLDARRAETDPPPTRFTSVATSALLLQVVTIYTVNVLIKHQFGAWMTGDAAGMALALDSFTTRFGVLLSQSPLLLEAANWAWVALLASSVLLVLATGRIRTILVGLFAAVHLGMFLAMTIGIFPFISIAGLLPFLPSEVWDRVERWLPDAGLLPERIDRVVAARAAGAVPVVDGAAPSLGRLRSAGARAATVLVVVLVLVATVWNLATLGVVSLDTGESGISPSQHRWDMFAYPPSVDVWYQTPATLASGDRIDALRGTALPPDETPTLRGYPSARWRKYLVSVRYGDPPGLVDDLGAGLCRRAAHRTDQPVEHVTISVVEEPTRYNERSNTTRIDLGTYACR